MRKTLKIRDIICGQIHERVTRTNVHLISSLILQNVWSFRIEREFRSICRNGYENREMRTCLNAGLNTLLILVTCFRSTRSNILCVSLSAIITASEVRIKSLLSQIASKVQLSANNSTVADRIHLSEVGRVAASNRGFGEFFRKDAFLAVGALMTLRDDRRSHTNLFVFWYSIYILTKILSVRSPHYPPSAKFGENKNIF